MTTTDIAPVVSSIQFDKTSYSPGDTITVTIAYVPGVSGERAARAWITVKDSLTQMNTKISGQVFVTTENPPTLRISDASREWKLASDSLGVQVWTATA